MGKESIYSPKFFQTIRTGARLSASEIVPLVMEWVRPASVIDVGCGTGEFLGAFQEHGVKEILGIDGEYVDRSLLAIHKENFKALDISKPFILDKTYDLALCLEVAE